MEPGSLGKKEGSLPHPTPAPSMGLWGLPFVYFENPYDKELWFPPPRKEWWQKCIQSPSTTQPALYTLVVAATEEQRPACSQLPSSFETVPKA